MIRWHNSGHSCISPRIVSLPLVFPGFLPGLPRIKHDPSAPRLSGAKSSASTRITHIYLGRMQRLAVFALILLCGAPAAADTVPLPRARPVADEPPVVFEAIDLNTAPSECRAKLVEI